jgi:hypothetical protein
MKLDAQWIVGFVDGEGCFHIDVHVNQTARHKIQIQPEFVIVQREVDVQVLHAIKNYFGCGRVLINRKDHTSTRMMFRVKALDDLHDKIIPFFEQHQLKTKKKIEFIRFRQIVRKIKANYHKESPKQFLEILKISQNLRICSKPLPANKFDLSNQRFERIEDFKLKQRGEKQFRSTKLNAQIDELTKKVNQASIINNSLR